MPAAFVAQTTTEQPRAGFHGETPPLIVPLPPSREDVRVPWRPKEFDTRVRLSWHTCCTLWKEFCGYSLVKKPPYFCSCTLRHVYRSHWAAFSTASSFFTIDRRTEQRWGRFTIGYSRGHPTGVPIPANHSMKKGTMTTGAPVAAFWRMTRRVLLDPGTFRMLHRPARMIAQKNKKAKWNLHVLKVRFRSAQTNIRKARKNNLKSHSLSHTLVLKRKGFETRNLRRKCLEMRKDTGWSWQIEIDSNAWKVKALHCDFELFFVAFTLTKMDDLLLLCTLSCTGIVLIQNLNTSNHRFGGGTSVLLRIYPPKPDSRRASKTSSWLWMESSW